MSDEIMENETWSVGENRETDNIEMTSETCALINGSCIDINPGDVFKNVIQSLASNAGFGKFKVYLNNEEIKPNESPELVNEGDKIELRQYDVAGI